jgi:hypothetical protein
LWRAIASDLVDDLADTLDVAISSAVDLDHTVGRMPWSRSTTSKAHVCCGWLDRSYVAASQGLPTATKCYCA